MHDANELLTRDEVAKFFKVAPTTIDRWRREDGLPVLRLGHRRLRFRRADIEAWIERQNLTATAQ